MQLLALYCFDHLALWDLLTLITAAIVHRNSKLYDLHASQVHHFGLYTTPFMQHTRHCTSNASQYSHI